MPHPPLYTAPHRLGPAVHEELFRRLVRSRDYLAAGLGHTLRLQDAAREACLSPYRYQRLFTRTFGVSPLEFVTRLRMDEVKRLLALEQTPVTEVCCAVGYESLGSFSTRFRNLVGQSPREYQRALRRVFPVPAQAVHRHIPTCFLEFYGVKLFCFFYSFRSATCGSIRAARKAGRYPANAPTPTSNATVSASVNGSAGFTPYI